MRLISRWYGIHIHTLTHIPMLILTHTQIYNMRTLTVCACTCLDTTENQMVTWKLYLRRTWIPEWALKELFQSFKGRGVTMIQTCSLLTLKLFRRYVRTCTCLWITELRTYVCIFSWNMSWWYMCTKNAISI